MAFYSVVNGLHHSVVEEFWAELRFDRQFKHPPDLLAAWNGFVKAPNHLPDVYSSLQRILEKR